MVGDTSFVGCWRIVFRIRSVVICSVVTAVTVFGSVISLDVTVFGSVGLFRCVTVFGTVGLFRLCYGVLYRWVILLSCVCCNLYGLSCVVVGLGCFARHHRETTL